ncbi:MAG: hypothetical protein C4536_14590 [Actinobacteria bacterium]|jgi:hypothetical protein|nr:MAG: hypothetical protein C4536_14590 [Actinomycetota bacterium]
MSRERCCGECKTPLFVSRELNWESNGIISLHRSPRNRMVLYESEIIDNLFKGIEELIGANIEHIVIESRRREVRKYIEGSFPAWVRKPLIYLNEKLGDKAVIRHAVRIIRESLGKVITRQVFDIGRLYGYGDVKLGPLWGTGSKYPWRVNVISDPYSVLFFAAEALASVEAFEGMDHWVKYEEIGEDVYEYTTCPGPHPIELEQWLKRMRYEFKPGEIEYERCAGCGIPMEVAELEWDIARGTIHDSETGWRKALFGPFAMDAVLHDLEAELGSSISEVVVEAQRRYIKSHVGGGNWRRSGTTFAQLTALRGLGNITWFEADEKHLSVLIQNSCMPLLVLGMAQAIYETAMGRESSTYDWKMGEDGDFEFTVRI